MLPLLAFSFVTIQHWITTRGFIGGVAVVFLLLFACGLGLPLPEDIPLIIAGAFLCTDTRSWIIVGIAAWCGIMGGDIILYSMGKRFGLEITRVPFVGKHVTRERIKHVEELFNRYGVAVVAIGRLFAGIRGAMVVCAGTIRFNFIKFLIADGLAAIVSGGLFMMLGHWIGTQLADPEAQRRIKEFKELFIGGGIVVALAFVAFLIWRHRNVEKLHDVEEKAVTKVAAAEKKVARTIAQATGKIVGKQPQPPEPSQNPQSPESHVDGSA